MAQIIGFAVSMILRDTHGETYHDHPVQLSNEGDFSWISFASGTRVVSSLNDEFVPIVSLFGSHILQLDRFIIL